MSNKKTAKPAVSKSDQRQIARAVAKAKSASIKLDSAQKTIPYQQMYPDGLCHVHGNTYSKTIQFLDINYRLVQDSDKSEIFGGWCKFLNYFDSSIHFQLSFYNLKSELDEDLTVTITPRDDDYNDVRQEYNDMLQNQLAKGNYGIRKTKFLSFSIIADDTKQARQKLNQIELELLANFKELGVPAYSVDGKSRLKVLYNLYHPQSSQPFRFEWKWLAQSGMSTKDLIAPTSFEFQQSRVFKVGTASCSVSYLQILAPELSDDILHDFLSMNSSLAVNIHIESIDQTAAIRTLKRKITDLDKMKIEEQKKVVRSGYDMDILPSDLATFGHEAKRLLQDLQSHNERMFLGTFLIMNIGDTRQQLKNDVFRAGNIAQRHNCTLLRLDFQQENTLSAVVLKDIHIHAILAKADKDRIKQQLTAGINSSQKQAMKIINKQLSEAENREAVIDANIKRLYEDKCEGKLPENVFQKLLNGYLAEQTDLEKTLNNMREQQSEAQTESHDIDRWMDTISQYMDIKTLDRPTLLELIDTITIGEGRKVNGKRHQDITINYRFIGNLLENAKEDIV